MALADAAVLMLILAPLSAAVTRSAVASTGLAGLTAVLAPCGHHNLAGCGRRVTAVDLSCCTGSGCTLPVPTLAGAPLLPPPSWHVASYGPAAAPWRRGVVAHPAVPPPRVPR